MLKRWRESEKGFTLAELLIVVAIIAVLVAVSIPIFTAQLEKAREETDEANWRAAKAAFIVNFLDEGAGANAASTEVTGMRAVEWAYDAPTGTVVPLSEYDRSKGYGEGTTAVGLSNDDFADDHYDRTADYSGAYITARYLTASSSGASTEQFSMQWVGSNPETPAFTIELSGTT